MSPVKNCKKIKPLMANRNNNFFQLELANLPDRIHQDTARALQRLARERGKIVWDWKFGIGERATLRHRKPMPASQWAERHRVMHLSSRPGPWRNQVTPYATGIMDAGFFPSVRTVSIMKCPQSAGTEAIHNCVAYTIDRAPGLCCTSIRTKQPPARMRRTESFPCSMPLSVCANTSQA